MEKYPREMKVSNFLRGRGQCSGLLITAPVLISLSLLVGTFFGQIFVGILADRYGRKRMYGIELLVLTLSTVLMALSSKGALASTNGLVWIVAWRFIMGLGIGGDYPLSAVITAEYVVPSGCLKPLKYN